jgi:RNA polymerase sigma factor (sigma-70 family)
LNVGKRVKDMAEPREMSRSIELEQPLEAGAMREIERSLRARLKAHQLSESFIERHCEEAIQRAWLDYLHAVTDGAEVGNPGAFVAKAAFCRAIDELRHESHPARGVEIDGLLASARFGARAAEDVAVERLAAEELHAAIETLPAEERQILTLHYFEQLSDRRASETLYCSESTFRRRRQRALKRLGLKLGLTAPEPGSELAIEIGLAAWVCLRGGSVAVGGGALGRLSSLADGARDGAGWLLERTRDLAASLTASGSGERLGALAGSQAARVFAGCAGTAAVCVAGGVIVTGFGGGAAQRPAAHHARADARSASSTRPTEPLEAPAGLASGAEGAGSPSAPDTRKERRRLAREAERRQVEAEASGIARAGAEAPAPGPGAESAAAPPGETVTVSPSGGVSPESAAEEEQAEQQFGAFK